MPIDSKRILSGFQAAEGFRGGLQFVADEIVKTLPADACFICLSDNAKGEYVLFAHQGLALAEGAKKVSIKFGSGLVGLVGEREEPVNLEDMQEHEAYKQRSALDESPFHGFLGVAMIHQRRLLGVIVVERKAAAQFSEDEEAALVTLAVQLGGAMPPSMVQRAIKSANKRRSPSAPKMVQGIGGAPGIAMGKAMLIFPPADLDAVPDQTIRDDDIEEEVQFFEQALDNAKKEIQQLQQRAQRSLSVTEQALFDAYLRILESRSLLAEVKTEITEQKQWAQGALRRVIKRHVLQFEALDDPYLRERAVDFRDLGRRILAQLQQVENDNIEFPKYTILVSDEVTATMLMEVPEGQLAGVVSTTGSSNSHVAILARALNVPTVMGAEELPLDIINNKPLVVDGYNGEVYISPAPDVRREFARIMEDELRLNQELALQRDVPAETTDGHKIQLLVNTGLMADAKVSLTVGADGVGLFRTEMPFMVRNRFPSEEEQKLMYRQLLNAFAPKPVIMRTLDIGGDKSLPYFPVEEANPFLGWRGIRISLDYPQIFLQQLRAMLAASEDLNNLAIMFPMITSVNEVETAKRFVKQAFDELTEEGLKLEEPKIGIMVEVPAAVYQARELAKIVDFISVGSNDLIQYMLAVDRNNSKVANLYQSYHPAVLRALADVVEAGHKSSAKVSICGELASSPIGALLLLGMGYDSLSMNASALPKIKWVVRSFSLAQAKQITKEALKLDDAREVREHVEMALEAVGLAGLIRAGV